jgi:GDP-4-dehydro-6-deoxy-D-mannose reductase
MAFETILVTGAGGFAGQYLLPILRVRFPASHIIGAAREALDVTDAPAVDAALARWQPDVCIHLAGIASVSAARAAPDRAWAVNLHGALNVAHGILRAAPHCRMIFVSSAECYGGSFNAGVALGETAPLAPLNLYAATKAAAELALGALAGEGLRLLRLRPFNHTGPGQSEAYVVPAFAGQIARIEAGLAPPEIFVGALDPEREFLDVRDVCNAYALAVEKFDELPNNQILNLASGKPLRIGAMLDYLLSLAECRVTIRRDPARLRPAEIMKSFGNAALAETLLGWRPAVQAEDTFASLLFAARRGTSY